MDDETRSLIAEVVTATVKEIDLNKIDDLSEIVGNIKDDVESIEKEVIRNNNLLSKRIGDVEIIQINVKEQIKELKAYNREDHLALFEITREQHVCEHNDDIKNLMTDVNKGKGVFSGISIFSIVLYSSLTILIAIFAVIASKWFT